MPNPTLGDVHVDAALTDVSVGYLLDENHSVATRVFPRVPVANKSGAYFVYSKDDFLRIEAQKRAPGTASAGGNYNITTATFNCDNYAVHKDVADQIAANADPAIDMEQDAAKYTAQQLLMLRDREWATSYFTTSLWTGAADFTPAALWDTSTATPVKDVKTKQADILKATGRVANKLVLGIDAFNGLCTNATIRDYVKYTQRAVVTEELLATLFGVQEVLVARLTNTPSAEGATSVQAMLINAKDALLVYAPQNPGLHEASGGYTFTWNAYGADLGLRTKSFRLEEFAATRVESEMAFDMKLVASDVGVFFNNVVS